MARYLVTGACGFIGSNYVHFLHEQDPDASIVAVDNLGFAGNEANLDGVREVVPLEVADIADYDRMASCTSATSPTRS